MSLSVTYTFSNTATADATQVNQNFTDILNILSDGTKALSILNLKLNGTASFTGNLVCTTLTTSVTYTFPAASGNVLVTNNLTVPTVQKFTSGSGTYTTPTNPAAYYIRVEMIGGGGGGGGAGGGGATGGTGGNTTFGTSLLTANGGLGGTNGSAGGVGGTASLGSGPIGLAISGGSGGPGAFANANAELGGVGGNGALGGGGGCQAVSAGLPGADNTGGGGGGGSSNNSAATDSGGGGGAGGYVNAIIAAPSATYSYNVGTAGTSGTAGTNGTAGGAGGKGVIVVWEFYQ